MDKRLIKKLITISQFIPFVFIIISIVTQFINGISNTNYLLNLFLIEMGFLLPVITFIIYWSIRQNKKNNSSISFQRYIILCYLWGVSISLLSTLLIILILELSNIYTCKLTTCMVLFALISPFVTTVFTIRQLSVYYKINKR